MAQCDELVPIFPSPGISRAPWLPRFAAELGDNCRNVRRRRHGRRRYKCYKWNWSARMERWIFCSRLIFASTWGDLLIFLMFLKCACERKRCWNCNTVAPQGGVCSTTPPPQFPDMPPATTRVTHFSRNCPKDGWQEGDSRFVDVDLSYFEPKDQSWDFSAVWEDKQKCLFSTFFSTFPTHPFQLILYVHFVWFPEIIVDEMKREKHIWQTGFRGKKRLG